MVIVVNARVEEEYRHIFAIKRGMIARPVTVLLQLEREAPRSVQIFNKRLPLRRCAYAADYQRVVPHPTNHIHIEHCHGLIEREDRLFHIMARS